MTVLLADKLECMCDITSTLHRYTPASAETTTPRSREDFPSDSIVVIPSLRIESLCSQVMEEIVPFKEFGTVT